MAFQRGTSTSVEDLLSELFTFASANGWTIDIPVGSGEAAFHRSTVYIQMTYTSSAITPYQSLAFGGSPFPAIGDHPRTAHGQGNLPQINNIPGPHAQYFFFEGNTYLHVVLEYQSGFYRHFSFGILEKIGTWTGGEYMMPHYHDQNAIRIDNILATGSTAGHNPPFDGGHSAANSRGGSIHARGLRGQSSDERWLLNGFSSGISVDNDQFARRLWTGTVRGGYTGPLQDIGRNALNELTLFHRILCLYIDTSIAPATMIALGYAPNMFTCALTGLTPGQTLEKGGDTYYIFPLVRKLPPTNDDTEASKFLGLAYKLNTL